ncbi:MAG: hypothetical protein HYV65_01270 [Candidatus Spechtbacteria bacterium]|nr:hypothetical protein [Candidatus Spechtbacteria bacterium]
MSQGIIKEKGRTVREKTIVCGDCGEEIEGGKIFYCSCSSEEGLTVLCRECGLEHDEQEHPVRVKFSK